MIGHQKLILKTEMEKEKSNKKKKKKNRKRDWWSSEITRINQELFKMTAR